KGDRFGSGGFDCRYRRIGICLRGGAVIVDRDCLCAVPGKVARNQLAEILCAASDDDGLTLDTVIGHDVRFLPFKIYGCAMQPLPRTQNIVYHFPIKMIILTSLVAISGQWRSFPLGSY